MSLASSKNSSFVSFDERSDFSPHYDDDVEPSVVKDKQEKVSVEFEKLVDHVLTTEEVKPVIKSIINEINPKHEMKQEKKRKGFFVNMACLACNQKK